MSTSTIQSVRSAIKTNISSRLSTDAVTGVTVRQYPPTGTDTQLQDWIFLIEADATRQHLTFGATNTGKDVETYDFTGQVWVYKSGASEDDLSAAETRALAVFASVENAIRITDDSPDSSFHAQITRYKVTPYPDASNSVCVVEFTIEVEAHL